MKWREVLQFVLGPDIEYLPAAVSTIVFCLLAMILCVIMHKLSHILLPSQVKQYALDYFKCLAFCTYPLGYGLTRTHHGYIGYCLVMIPFNVVSLMLMKDGSVSPVENFLNFIKGVQSLWKSVLRTIVQVIGAISAFYLAQQIIKLEFHEDFTVMKFDACTTDLKIPVSLGFLLELAGTGWETFLWSHRLVKNEKLNLMLLSTDTALLVSLGVHLTGMYMQPALATGYTIGCHGTTVLQHFIVYWIGPFIGGYIAYSLTPKISTKEKRWGPREEKEEMQKTERKLSDRNPKRRNRYYKA